jgi:glycosyltransferase involved in cell wall biosynthesis
VEPLSVLILTRDEADRLPDCLARVSFADEILVVDSGSTDETVAIAEAAGARVLTREFTSHADQKNWGLERLRNRWVLILDADERVSADLADEIRAVLGDAARADGYWLRRRSRFQGRWIRGCGWQRDRVLRLFDRERGRYDRRAIHEEVRVDGRVAELRARLDHDPYRGLSEWVARTERYACLGAEELARRGRPFRLRDLVVRPPARFLKQWLIRGGWRDGVEGLVLCAISAWGVLLKYAHLRERFRRDFRRPTE